MTEENFFIPRSVFFVAGNEKNPPDPKIGSEGFEFSNF